MISNSQFRVPPLQFSSLPLFRNTIFQSCLNFQTPCDVSYHRKQTFLYGNSAFEASRTLNIICFLKQDRFHSFELAYPCFYSALNMVNNSCFGHTKPRNVSLPYDIPCLTASIACCRFSVSYVWSFLLLVCW